MLRQILKDMYVDPEILAELPEEQRELLFFKIRQEQVRRFNEWENCQPSQALKHRIIRNAKKVCILEDAEGNPWTWVFGDNPGEVSIEEKWKRLYEKRMQEAIKAVVLEEHDQKNRKVSSGKRITLYGGNDDKTGVICSTKRPVIRAEHDKNVRQSSSARKVVITGGNEGKYRKISMPAKLESVTTTGAKLTDDSTRQNLLRVKQPKSVRFSPTSSPVTSPDVTPVNPRKMIPKKSPTPSPTQSPMARRNLVQKTISSPVTSGRIGDTVDGMSNRPSVPPVPPKRVKSGTALLNMVSKSNSFSDLVNDLRISDRKHRDRLSNYDNVELVDTREDDGMSNEEWEKQLLRFKEADERRSAAARRASLEYRRQTLLAKQPKKFRDKIRSKLSKLGSGVATEKRSYESRPLPQRPDGITSKQSTDRNGQLRRPRNKDDVKDWFADTQLQVLTDEEFIGIPGWFHGTITRQESEDLLRSKPHGSFLIRISDKIWGYTLTYKDEDRIKHFLIDASEERCYHFFGNDQIRHESLKELLEYHKVEEISLRGEKLRSWVGQSNPKNPDYGEMLPKCR